MTSTEIALRQPGGVAERDTVDGWVIIASDVIKLANVICETEFVPEVYRGNAPATAAAILAGRELGIGPMTALRHVQVVKGSPSLSAEYKRARVLAAGHEFHILEITTQRCKVKGRRRGSTEPPLEVTFTMDDARTAGLVRDKGAWKTRPRRMLFARAASELCDFLFSDIVNGLPTAELLTDGGDGFEGYDEAPAQESPKPARRTARRGNLPAGAGGEKTAAPDAGAPPSPAGGGSPAPASIADPHSAAGAGIPLPGEDEPEPGDARTEHAGDGSVPSSAAQGLGAPVNRDAPGTATRGKHGQLTALWTILHEVYGFTTDEKDQARAAVEVLVGRELAGGTTGDLSFNEARTVIDALANLKTLAEGNGLTPREVLIGHLATVERETGETP